MDDETLKALTELVRAVMQYPLNLMVYEVLFYAVCPASIVGFLVALRIASFFRRGA